MGFPAVRLHRMLANNTGSFEQPSNNIDQANGDFLQAAPQGRRVRHASYTDNNFRSYE